jgi:hypothetical protein
MPPKVSSVEGYKLAELVKGAVKLSSENFMKWRSCIEDIAYFRDWEEHSAFQEWDGVEEDDDQERKVRKEAYWVLSQTMPVGSEYHHLKTGIKPGDAAALNSKVLSVFMSKTAANKGGLRKEFVNLSMISTRLPVSHFASLVNEHATKLKAVGETICDDEIKTVFLSGLPKSFSDIVTTCRNSSDNYANTYTKVIEHARLNGLLQFREPFRDPGQGSQFNFAKFDNGNQGGNHHDGRRVRFKKKDKTNVTCYGCGQTGHFANEGKCKRSGDASSDDPSDGDSVDQHSALYSHGFVLKHEAQATRSTRHVDKEGVGETWLLDSGSSFHITPFASDFIGSNVERCDVNLTMGDGNVVNITAKADIQRETEQGRVVTLQAVLFSPSCPSRLMSEGVILTHGNSIYKDKLSTLIIDKTGKTIVTGTRTKAQLTQVRLNTSKSIHCDFRDRDRCQEALLQFLKNEEANHTVFSWPNVRHVNQARSINSDWGSIGNCHSPGSSHPDSIKSGSVGLREREIIEFWTLEKVSQCSTISKPIKNAANIFNLCCVIVGSCLSGILIDADDHVHVRPPARHEFEFVESPAANAAHSDSVCNRVTPMHGRTVKLVGNVMEPTSHKLGTVTSAASQNFDVHNIDIVIITGRTKDFCSMAPLSRLIPAQVLDHKSVSVKPADTHPIDILVMAMIFVEHQRKHTADGSLLTNATSISDLHQSHNCHVPPHGQAAEVPAMISFEFPPVKNVAPLRGDTPIQRKRTRTIDFNYNNSVSVQSAHQLQQRIVGTGSLALQEQHLVYAGEGLLEDSVPAGIINSQAISRILCASKISLKIFDAMKDTAEIAIVAKFRNDAIVPLTTDVKLVDVPSIRLLKRHVDNIIVLTFGAGTPLKILKPYSTSRGSGLYMLRDRVQVETLDSEIIKSDKHLGNITTPIKKFHDVVLGKKQQFIGDHEKAFALFKIQKELSNNAQVYNGVNEIWATTKKLFPIQYQRWKGVQIPKEVIVPDVPEQEFEESAFNVDSPSFNSTCFFEDETLNDLILSSCANY